MASDEIPSKETVRYARKVLKARVKRYKAFEASQTAAGNHSSAKRFRAVWAFIERDLLGSDPPGCVVTPFDYRWLSTEFREQMENAIGEYGVGAPSSEEIEVRD